MTDQKLCPTCHRPPCKNCNQAGLILDLETDRATACPHIEALRLHNYLGGEIARVKHVQESPLTGKLKDNLLIRAHSWAAMLPHLKLVLGKRYPHFRFNLVTDERILLVYLGNESFKLRSVEDREENGYTNSLADLMEPYDLTIVRVGHIFHKNKAAEGAFLEALSLRRFRDKPTWICDEDPCRRIESTIVWGSELDRYLDTYEFEELFLKDEVEADLGIGLETAEDREAIVALLGGPIAKDPSKPPPRAPTPPRIQQTPRQDPPALDLESVLGKSSKKRWQE